MTKEIRTAIVEHAIRWSVNMLTEVMNNHGKHLPKEAQARLQAAVLELTAANRAL